MHSWFWTHSVPTLYHTYVVTHCTCSRLTSSLTSSEHFFFLLHSTPLPGPACFWTSTWHRVYAPFSLPTLASAIREARFLTNIHRKSYWEVKARIRKKSANVSHNTTDNMVIVHMTFIFIWHFGTWKKDIYWTHFRTPCGFPMVLSPSPSTDTFIFSLIQLLKVYKHMFTRRYLNDYDLRLEWIKNPHYLKNFSIFSEVNAEYIMCRAGMYLF